MSMTTLTPCPSAGASVRVITQCQQLIAAQLLRLDKVNR